ncbi:MAG: hypothetical protein RDU89_06210 [bacterium]|nr:hypothetical protein [bacterium]
MATLGLILFDIAGGFYLSALNMAVALLLTYIWPRVRVTWRAALTAWLVNGVGLGIRVWVVFTYLHIHGQEGIMTAWLVGAALVLATAAVVSFATLRLRRMQGWVFMLILALLAFPGRITYSVIPN